MATLQQIDWNNTYVHEDEYGCLWIRDDRGNILCEAFYASEDQNHEEMEDSGYVMIPYEHKGNDVYVAVSEVESCQPSQPNPELQKLEDAIDLELNRLAASSEFDFNSRLMVERVEHGLRIFDDNADAVITNPQGFIDALKLIKPINWQAETLAEDNSDEVFDAIWAAAQDNA